MIAPALQLLSRVYKSPMAVIAEYLENGADANATKIWVVIEPDKITIVDNGTGMVPDILEEDRHLLEQFTKGDYTGETDIRQLVSPPTRSSLLWMVQYAAWSSKIQSEVTSQRGVYGIGSIAFRMIANKAIWTTKPNRTLALAFWGSKAIEQIPTWCLVPPTNDELAKNVITNRIAPVGDLKDPFGEPMVSGTSVEISELSAGVSDALRPALVQDYLAHRFSTDLRSKRISLTVVDRISVMGKRIKGGKKLEVLPPIFRGQQIVNTEGHLSNGKYPFRVEIWFDDKGTNLRPQIVRKKSAVGSITAIEDLNVFPWNSGQVSGTIEWPDIPEKDAPWDSGKHMPLPSTSLSQWIHALRFIAKDISESMDLAKKRSKDEMLQRRVAAVAKALSTAMAESEIFSHMMYLPPKKRNASVVKAPRSQEEDNETRIRVVNEYGSPLRGVEVVLEKNGKEISRSKTRFSGTVNFGSLENGKYRVKLMLPKNSWKCVEEPLGFEIRYNLPRVKSTLTVVTGEPRTASPDKLPGIILWPRAMGNETQLYSIERITRGIIEINVNHAGYNRALLSGNTELQVWYESLFAAMAVVNHLFPDEPAEYLFERATSLQAETLGRLEPKPVRKKTAKQTPVGRK